MFREILTHTVGGLNEHLRIRVMDEPGAGGACHHYRITYSDQWTWDTHFQEGPIQEVGVNGVSNEALLAIVRDRLESFQAGAYACGENAEALECVMLAMHALEARTLHRLKRGVEGTSAV